MDEKAKKDLKEIVEGVGIELYTDQMNAKDELKDICKATEDMVGVKASQISKMIVTLYKSNLEEEKAKFEEFDGLYREVLG